MQDRAALLSWTIAMKWIPTALSLSRIVFMPFVVPAILRRDYPTALWMCIIAGATDFFDGQIARRFHWMSRLGAWADAVSDKVLLSAVYVAFWMVGEVPGWFVALVLGRDLLILLMAGIGLAFTQIRDFPPSIWGKLSTNVQIGFALFLLAQWKSLIPAGLWLCTGTTAFSGAHYLFTGLTRLQNSKPQGD